MMTDSTPAVPTPRSSRILATTKAARMRRLSLVGLAGTTFLAIAVELRRSDGPTTFDDAVLAAMIANRTSGLDRAATALTALGSFTVVAVIAALFAGFLVWRTRNLLLPLTLLITVAETSSIVYLTKEVVGRDRPPVAAVVGAPALDPSFPSGHTTSGTVVWVLGALLLASTLTHRWVRIVVTAAGIAVAVTIGLTRAYLGYHWATDVLGGWLLATVLCATALYLAARLRPHTDRLGAVLDAHLSAAPVRRDPRRSDGVLTIPSEVAARETVGR